MAYHAHHFRFVGGEWTCLPVRGPIGDFHAVIETDGEGVRDIENDAPDTLVIKVFPERPPV